MITATALPGLRRVALSAGVSAVCIADSSASAFRQRFAAFAVSRKRTQCCPNRGHGVCVAYGGPACCQTAKLSCHQYMMKEQEHTCCGGSLAIYIRRVLGCLRRTMIACKHTPAAQPSLPKLRSDQNAGEAAVRPPSLASRLRSAQRALASVSSMDRQDVADSSANKHGHAKHAIACASAAIFIG